MWPLHDMINVNMITKHRYNYVAAPWHDQRKHDN